MVNDDKTPAKAIIPSAEKENVVFRQRRYSSVMAL